MFGNFGMGINFGNMNLTSEAIDKKLNDPNTKIEDLLREEELLQEFRSQNQKLIEYFDRDKIKRLIDYIIKMPEVDEHEKGYKFPFLCSQIFGLELDKMLNQFFVTNKQLEEENKKKEENQKGEEKKVESSNNESQQVAPEQKEKESENKDEAKKEPKEEEKKEEEKKEEEKEEKKEEKKEEEKKEEEKKEKEKKEEEKKEEEKKEEEKKEDDDGNIEEEKEEPESKENKMELLDYLFSFLEAEEDKKLNYVLCGYFSSLISNLLNLNPTELLKYIYKERSDVLDKMVNHCYRKSISDILSKLLHFENYFQSEDSLDKDTRSEMESTRKMTIADIFQKIDINMDNEDLNSIYFLITGLFDPSNILEEKEIFKSLIEERRNMRALLTKQTLFNLDLSKSEDYEIVENKRKNFMVIIDIILFLLNNIKKLKLEIPSNVSDSKLTINHTKLSQEIFDNLNPLIKNLFNKKNEEQRTVLLSFNEYQLKPLGEYKIKIIDLLSHLVPYLKNISKFYDEILIETEFFENAFNYLYEYEWNNIYQESLLSLLKSLINDADNHQLIQEHLFNKLKIIDIIKTNTNSEDKFKFANETVANPISHGYYSFFVSLSYKINTALGGTPIVITSNTTARQGSFSFIARVPEEGDKKAAMSLLYGGFDDEENNENEAEKEEEKYNYESMKKYISDEWRVYFENISDVIKQYENKDWPEESKKKEEEESPFNRGSDDKEEDLLGENKGPSDREKNIFDDNNDDDDDDGGRRGVRDEGRIEDNNNNDVNPFSKGVDTNDFDFGDNKNENKEENKVGENVFGNSNANDFEFDDDDKNKDENKKNDNESKITGEENKNEGAEKEKEVNESKPKEENKLEDKKEEEKKEDEEKKEENIKKEDENK